MPVGQLPFSRAGEDFCRTDRDACPAATLPVLTMALNRSIDSAPANPLPIQFLMPCPNGKNDAQPCAAPVERAVADQGVPACRDRYRVGSTRADGDITVNAGAGHGHGPRPRTRQPRCRAADSIQVTSQGAIGGILRRARRREPGQEHSGQGQTDQGDSHFPWTKRAWRVVPGVRRTCASTGSCGAPMALARRQTQRIQLCGLFRGLLLMVPAHIAD